MSVTYANALAKRIDGSFLCCTRMEGLLKNQLSPEVGYLFLNKKNILDRQAFQKLRKFVKENQIDIIQAHSSSWFLALLIQLSLPGVKLIWHDHYGRELSTRKTGFLKPASKFFDGIIAVNKDLETWSHKNLHCGSVRYFRNFLPEVSTSRKNVKLRGGDSFKIVCVANFRPQKDHLNLLQAFVLIKDIHPNLTLHLIGKDEQSKYSEEIRNFIQDHKLVDSVLVYGEQENIPALLQQANMGVLSSASEGLPVSLLEYGRAGIPVICTRVGQCEEVVGNRGKLIPPKDPQALAHAIDEYIQNSESQKKDAQFLLQEIKTNYSEETIIPTVLDFFIDR